MSKRVVVAIEIVVDAFYHCRDNRNTSRLVVTQSILGLTKRDMRVLLNLVVESRPLTAAALRASEDRSCCCCCAPETQCVMDDLVE